ncbi:MAG: GNAT family N-acetyltransferase [Chloroflexi bacterium]|nr:GNAT family N-acetyltransferase [Chloroflexota bacterium]
MSTKTQASSPEATPPVFNIVGEKVALGPLRKDLVPTYTRWYNNFHTLRTLDTTPAPLTLEQDERQHERLVALSEAQVSFTVYERSSCRPIGSAGLLDVDYRDRSAEFALAIGEPDARGEGYGTETTQLVVDYAFTALGLHNVMLTVFEYNLAGIHVYTKVGFREFGRRRESIFMGGKLWDIILMDCLSTEWEPGPVLAETFRPDEPRPAAS